MLALQRKSKARIENNKHCCLFLLWGVGGAVSRLENIFMNYKDYLKSDYWQTFRQVAYKVFNHSCHFCKSRNYLNVHHTNYYKTTLRTGKGRNKPRWFLVVCRSCHFSIHRIQKEENVGVYKATREFRNRYYRGKDMSISKKKWNKVYRELGLLPQLL